jgi:hypothetical protein
VVEPGLARPQSVFVAAEKRQAFVNEALQRLQGLGAGNWPGEAVECAGMVGKAGIHQCNDLLREGVRLKGRSRRHQAGALWAKGFAVIGVKVPLAAAGLAVVHQDVVALP